MTKASHVLSIFMFLEAKMSKFSYFLYHDHYLFAASPPSIHEFLEIQEMMNRGILSYRLPSSINLRFKKRRIVSLSSPFHPSLPRFKKRRIVSLSSPLLHQPSI